MVDPMLKLQTKEHSITKKKKPGVGKTPSIVDLSLGGSNNQNVTQKQDKNKKSKNKSGTRLPNMDLIEDVSAAS